MSRSTVATAMMRQEPSLWPFVSLLLICVLLGLLIARTHAIVNLGNDHAGQPLLPASVLHPGESTTGLLTLTDGGVAPIVYSLAVDGPNGGPPPSSAQLKVTTSSGTTLYSGKLPSTAVELGTMYPGDSRQLQVTVSVPAGDGDPQSLVPLNIVFTWGARPALVWNAWWIWIAGALILAAGGFFTIWVRRRAAA